MELKYNLLLFTGLITSVFHNCLNDWGINCSRLGTPLKSIANQIIFMLFRDETFDISLKVH